MDFPKELIDEKGRNLLDGREQIVWMWKPSDAEIQADHDIYGDMAEEYAIVVDPKIPGGLILFGKYSPRGWYANPSGRPVILHLLRERGTSG